MFSGEERESWEGWVEFAQGGHDFLDSLLKWFWWARRSRLLVLFAGTNPKKSTALLYGCFIYCTVFEGVRHVLLLLYGALNLAQISRGVLTVYSCCMVHLFLAQISRKVQLSLLLYGLLINCTDIEEVYGLSSAVRTVIYWHDFQGEVRPGAAVQLHLVWHRKRRRV